MRTDQDIGSCRDELLAPDPRALVLDELAPGTIVGGRYRIDRQLGRGAMGVVVAATHTGLNEPVALKFLSSSGGSLDEACVQRFQREARVTARLRNEHIARVTDVDVFRDGVLYMVMELLEGTELTGLLDQGTTLSPEVAIGYVLQVCDGLAEAHGRGVIHRDLKPSNLFVVRRPDGSELVKILDFGISKSQEGDVGDDGLTHTGIVLGTPKYMAPEQLFAAGEVDARADVFSLGAVLFRCLTGRPPFNEGNFAKLCAEVARGMKPPLLRELAPQHSEKLEAAIARALDVDRSLRTANVAELAYELLEAIDDPRAGSERERLSVMLERSGDLRATGAFAASGSFTWTGAATSSTGGRTSAGATLSSATDSVAPLPTTTRAKSPFFYVGLGAFVFAALVFLLARGARPLPATAAAPLAVVAAIPPDAVVTPPPSATPSTPSPPPSTPPSPPVAEAPRVVASALAPPVRPVAHSVSQGLVRPAPKVGPTHPQAPPSVVPTPAPKPKKNPLEDRQ